MLWAILATVAFGIVGLWRQAIAPAVNLVEDGARLGQALRLLLAYGIDGARLVVRRREAPDQALSFVKYIVRPGEVGLRAECVAASQSPDAYGRFADELRRRAVPHEQVVGPHGPAIRFDFGRDVGLGLLVAQVFFEEGLGVRLSGTEALFHDVLIKNVPRLTGIDAPDVDWG